MLMLMAECFLLSLSHRASAKKIAMPLLRLTFKKGHNEWNYNRKILRIVPGSQPVIPVKQI